MIHPIRIAHRGASGQGLAPENTLAAFERAIQIGVDAVELDVRAKYGVEILLIKSQPPGRLRVGSKALLKKVPKPNVRIHRGDILLVAGEKDRIDRLRRL